MDRIELLDLVEVLGHEFERRGMRVQLEALRLYYLALKKQLVAPGDSLRVAWSGDMTIEWLSLLRIEPYRHQYPVRDASYRCPCGARARTGAVAPTSGDLSHVARGTAQTETTFPGGYKARCSACREVWLVLTTP